MAAIGMSSENSLDSAAAVVVVPPPPSLGVDTLPDTAGIAEKSRVSDSFDANNVEDVSSATSLHDDTPPAEDTPVATPHTDNPDAIILNITSMLSK